MGLVVVIVKKIAAERLIFRDFSGGSEEGVANVIHRCLLECRSVWMTEESQSVASLTRRDDEG